MLEAIVVNPNPYEMYAMTWHGFFLGLLAFFFGFCFVLTGQSFWQTALKWRWVFLLLAIALFIYRIMQAQMRVPNFQISIESTLWIFSVLAFGHRYLNRGSNALNYLSQAAYPVYILHMIFLFLGSLLIFPLAIPVQLQFVLVLLFTVAGCFVVYEFVVRRIALVRPLFGLKRNAPAITSPASGYSTQIEPKV
jgi:glucan biosynthesis protein C